MGKFKLALFLFATLTAITNSVTLDADTDTGIGIDGGSEPSSPEDWELVFENKYQKHVYYIIQKFKKTITCDPKEVTQTWVGAAVCDYKGFFCSIPPTRKADRSIASVDFNGFKLSAPTVNGFVDKLPDLALFHANSNNFSGTVPDLRNSTFLYELDFSNNNLIGSFPQNLLPLDNLLFLDIRFNFFAGSVPPNIFKLGLDVLFLNNNGFAGALPSNLGSTTAAYLTFANNKFTGPIPSSISNTSQTLLEVLFLNNRLSGCLPFEVGLLKKATVFDAGFNRITGPIPLSFGCLKNIEQLNLAGNLLYGEVPDVLCKLGTCGGKLNNLSLSDNYFTSVGYSCWELIKKKKLDLRDNCILGLPNQRPAWECARFSTKPKICPFICSIPCHINQRDAGDAGEEEPPLALDAKMPGPHSGAVTYKAVHKQHG